jgi:hypothetical protein
MISWLGFGASPQLLFIQAGRYRENLLLSTSPTPSIREYLRTGKACIRAGFTE